MPQTILKPTASPVSKFPTSVIQAAQQAQKSYPEIYASISLAQWALESGYGKHDLGVYNYFGIKARDGEPFVEFLTKEVVAGKWTYVKARFRKFDSPLEAFVEHAKLFYRKRLGISIYRKALKASTPNEFAHALTGVYATDPQYGDKLDAIITVYNLKQFDLFAKV